MLNSEIVMGVSLMLLFIIELSVGAMFILLTAQMLAVGNMAVGLR